MIGLATVFAIGGNYRAGRGLSVYWLRLASGGSVTYPDVERTAFIHVQGVSALQAQGGGREEG